MRTFTAAVDVRRSTENGREYFSSQFLHSVAHAGSIAAAVSSSGLSGR
jgi:hypothetical protein